MATAPLDTPVSFGAFVLDPADARLVGPAGPVHLGNKAFRVLEALIAERGRLLTKETLFETVWDGTIVSESALTSVIKELRRALGDESREPRFIESVYGRGYRFLVPVGEAEPAGEVCPAPRAGNPTARGAAALVPADITESLTAADNRWSRRRVLAAGGTGALGVAAGALAIHFAVPRAVPPEIDQLVFRARQAMDQGTRAGQYQAIGLLRRVVALAPDYADGWGRLGIAYGVPSHYRERPEGLVLRARAEAAAHRALELDPDNAYGELALGTALPFVGPYLERDRHFTRAMAVAPDADDVLLYNAVALQFVGRAAESVPLYRRIKQRPLTPAVYGNYIMALWSAGLLEEADRALADAMDLYPADITIWSRRYVILMFSGRADAAIAQVQDSAGLPNGASPGTVKDLIAMARAVEHPDASQTAALVESEINEAHDSAAGAASAIPLLSALGRVDQAFTLTDGYYFNRGFTVPDYPTPASSSSPEQRQTRFLFEPSTQKMRADPRFEKLVGEVGLDDYWRRSAVPPDYRRYRA